MKKLIIILVFLCLIQNANALTDYLPKEWYFESDYLQGNTYGFGGEGYIYHDVCHATVDITFINMGGGCAYGHVGTQYGYHGQLTTTCANGQNIMNKMGVLGSTPASYAVPFISSDCGANPCPEDTGMLNESWVLKGNGFLGWGASQTVYCDPLTGNKTCVMEFSSNFGDGLMDSFVCYNDDIVFDPDFHQLQFWVDTYDPYNPILQGAGHNTHNLFEGVDFYENGLIYYEGETPSNGTYFYLQNGTNWDLNFSETVAESLQDIDKTLIINITHEPDDVEFLNGYTGLWDCDTGGNQQYYLEPNVAVTASRYALLESKCCNLLESQAVGTECKHFESTGSKGVDANGDFNFAVSLSCDTETFEPQFIYRYNTIDYPDHFNFVQTDLYSTDNPEIHKIFWGEGTDLDYELCFRFYDEINKSDVTVQNMLWSTGQDPDNLEDVYSTWLINATGGTFKFGYPVYTKSIFTAEGYNDTPYFYGQFQESALNPPCNNIYLSRGVGGADSTYNATIHAMKVGGTGDELGVELSLDCKVLGNYYINNVPYDSATGGVLAQNILGGSTCYVNADKRGCVGLTQQYYLATSNRDFNLTMTCPERNNTGYMDMNFFVHERGKTTGLDVLITVDNSDRRTITNSFGKGTIRGVPQNGEYTIRVQEDGYNLYLKDFDGQNPMDISLIPDKVDINQMIITVKNNRSGGYGLQPNATILVTVTDTGQTWKTGETGKDLYNYGRYEFTCIADEFYTIKATYQGKEKTLNKVQCIIGDEIFHTIDLSEGGSTPIEETADRIEDFGAYMWYGVEFLILMFFILVAKKIGMEILYGKS